MERTAFRTCPLCEATCGLEIKVVDDAVRRIRGDREDVFSHGFICPKGSTLQQLHTDPDRVRTPLIRRGGRFESATWDEAFEVIADGLAGVVERAGGDRRALAAYVGNPNVHSMSIVTLREMLKAMGSPNVFTASTADQMPKHVSAGLMFGDPDLIPVPDIDRTDYLLMLGANPLHSNGSLATAPDWPGRIERLRERGGRLVVVDPRRSKTADVADEHIAIRPGADALWLWALVSEVIPFTDVGDLPVTGLAELTDVAARFTPERVADATGVDPDVTRRIATELRTAPTAAVYGRIGTHTVPFGGQAAWLVDVINAITGNLDRPGGAMFPHAAHIPADRPGPGRGFSMGRWSSRVDGAPEVRGELPVACMVSEMSTPGEGRIRALITAAGNPVLSTPDGARLAEVLADLEFMVSIDIYVNETTRHADVILPAPSALHRPHYDFAFTTLSVRNVANYSEPVFPMPPDMLDEWEVHLTMAGILDGSRRSVEEMDEAWIRRRIERLTHRGGPLEGRDADDVVASLEPRRGPERLLDLLLRSGVHGDGFGAKPDGLTLDRLAAEPHGVDFGPLTPRLPDALQTSDEKIALAPEPLMDDIARLEASLAEPQPDLVLVGRRHVKSNNSWMHNIDVLVRGRPRCTLQVHPADAARFGVVDGTDVVLEGPAGSVTVPAEVTDGIAPGVVSLPHGWGHDLPGTELSVASETPGVSINDVIPTGTFDPVSGNAILSGIAVSVRPG